MMGPSGREFRARASFAEFCGRDFGIHPWPACWVTALGCEAFDQVEHGVGGGSEGCAGQSLSAVPRRTGEVVRLKYRDLP